MVKISLEITSTDQSDKKVTDRITYVNPQATNEQLVDFAKALLALSDDTYLATTKITEEAID